MKRKWLSILIKLRLLPQWLTNLTISSPRTFLFTHNMMISRLPIVDHQKKSSRNLVYSSKSISQVISNSKTVLMQACFPEFSIWRTAPSSSILTRLWTTWLRQSWFKTSSTFLITQDMSSHPKVTSTFLAAMIQWLKSSWIQPTFWTSTDPSWIPSTTCFTPVLNTSFTNSRTASSF